MSERRVSRGHEIISDGRTVWINGPDGCCVARFCPTGAEIHRAAAQQPVLGECLDCTHGLQDTAGWLTWRQKVKHHFGIGSADTNTTCGADALLTIEILEG